MDKLERLEKLKELKEKQNKINEEVKAIKGKKNLDSFKEDMGNLEKKYKFTNTYVKNKKKLPIAKPELASALGYVNYYGEHKIDPDTLKTYWNVAKNPQKVMLINKNISDIETKIKKEKDKEKPNEKKLNNLNGMLEKAKNNKKAVVEIYKNLVEVNKKK